MSFRSQSNDKTEITRNGKSSLQTEKYLANGKNVDNFQLPIKDSLQMNTPKGQTSLFENRIFAAYWNKLVGPYGDHYKRFLLDPIVLGTAGNLKGKVVMEMGCGNGYFAKKLIRGEPAKIILMDISKHCLDITRRNVSDPRITFLQHNIMLPWPDCISTKSVDILISNMVFNEIENIETPINEAFKVLKCGGRFIVATAHPAWSLFYYAQEMAEKKNLLFKGLGGYFRRGSAKIIFNAKNAADSGRVAKSNTHFALEYYQRTVADYINTLFDAGFRINHVYEPEITTKLLRAHPEYRDYVSHPVMIVFSCRK